MSLKLRLQRIEVALAPKGLGLAAKMHLATARRRTAGDQPPHTIEQLRERLAALRPAGMAWRILSRAIAAQEPAP